MSLLPGQRLRRPKCRSLRVLPGPFLLVDTADRIAMAGLYDGDKTLWETRASTGRPTLHWVSRSVSEALDKTGLALKDLKFLSCGVGPGGFTSVRIGISFMKAMAQALNLPLAGINRLEAAAMGCSMMRPAGATDRYFVRLPAAQNLEYAAIFRIAGGALPVCSRKPAALSIQQISRIRIPKSAMVVTAHPEFFYSGLPRMAALKAAAGNFESGVTLVPLYLRGATLGPPGSRLKVARRRHLR